MRMLYSVQCTVYSVQCTVYSVYILYTLNQSFEKFLLKNKEYSRSNKSKKVSFNTQGIFSFVRYYRKEIFVKGREPVGLRIS